MFSPDKESITLRDLYPRQRRRREFLELKLVEEIEHYQEPEQERAERREDDEQETCKKPSEPHGRVLSS